jgi:adenylosuccinate lyase
MIDRYSRKIMQDIWSLENKFRVWLDVEIAACEAHNKLGNIPDSALKIIKKKADINVERINEIEEVTNHDVIAFTTCVAEYIGPESRYVHLGLTSSDVVDTAFSILIKQSAEIILKDMKELLPVLKGLAYKYKDSLMMGRTHGVHAEPMTLGLKFALWYDEFGRNIRRFESAISEIAVGQISGAVGNYSNIDPFVEKYVCEKLGLVQVNISTQIIQRDRHAMFMSVLAVMAGTIEKIATEIRAAQKTEFNEMEEGFKKGQKGSSAMPHKRNPITCEKLTGLARVIRGNMLVSMENICLWHERDISHSSTERIIFPDSTMLMDHMLVTLKSVLENLVVHEDSLAKNLDLLGGVVCSQRLLLSMVNKGISREDAYQIAQSDAMKARDNGLKFRDVIRQDERVTNKLTEQEIESVFDHNIYKKHVDMIFKRVFS